MAPPGGRGACGPGPGVPHPAPPHERCPPPIAHEADRGPRAGADLVLRVSAELASVAMVGAALARALGRQGWAYELHPLVLLAVGEALTNAMEHGSPACGAVEVRLTVTSESAWVRVSNEGRPGAAVPLGAPVPPRATSARGRGPLVMGRIAEQVEVRSEGQGTSPLLRFGRPGATTSGNRGRG